jgi:hypothetical protein
MADKKSRLAEIYKTEKSRGGGIASTLGKRALEKMDPRKFFNQKGFLAAALPSLFKSYSATPEVSGRKLSQISSEIGQAKESRVAPFSTGALETKMDILTGETRELKIHSKLAAKNSVVLPSMARDMNVTRQNIVKLVKLQGGTATTKADMFFKRASDREAGYESRFSKAGGVTTKTPTQVGAKPKEEKESGGILGFLGTIASYLLKGGLLGLLAIGVGKLLENQDVLEGVKSFVKQVILGIQKIIQKGSELLGDLFSDPDIKEGFIKTFVAVKDLFVKGINLLGDLASDPRFAAGVVEVFSAIYEAVKKAFVSLDTYLKDKLNVPGGLWTVLAATAGVVVTFNGVLAGLTTAIEIAISRIARAGAAGAPGLPGAPGAPGKSGGRSGLALGIAGAAGVLLPFAVDMYHDYKNKNKKEPTPEDIEKMNQQAKADFINKNGREPTESEMQSSVSTKISNANQKEATTQKLETAGARAVGDIVAGASGIQGLSNLAPGKAPTTPTVTSKVPEGKPLTSFGSAGDKREMAKNKTMFEKLKVFFTKLQEKPKLMSVFKSKLAIRVGEAAMARLTALGVSLAAAPMSAGASLIFSLALTIWSIYDLYQLYGLVFGDGGLYDEVMNAESDEVSTDTAPAAAAIIPNTTPTVEGAGGAAFGMYSKPGMKPKPVPVPYNAAADSQAANTAKPTATAPSPTGAYRGQRSDTASASNTPTANKTALDITASTEGGGRYDLAFGDVPQRDGTIVNVLGKSKNFPQLAGKIIMTPQDFSGKPLTEMTLAEVQAFQEYRNREAPNTNALGKYGFMRTTLFGRDGKSGLVGQLKLPMDTIFSPDTQELLQATMREGNAAALRSEGVEATDANLNLANSVGAKGAAKLLKPENANRNALEVLELTGAAAYTNPHLNRLSKDVVAETYSKYDAKGMAPSSPSYGGTAVASAPPGPSYAAKGMAPSSPSYGGTAVASQSLPDFKMPSLGTLAATAPSVGDMITSATSAFGDITRAFDTAMASVTNITNNNTQASAAAQQSQGNLPSVYDDVFLNLFQRVT